MKKLHKLSDYEKPELTFKKSILLLKLKTIVKSFKLKCVLFAYISVFTQTIFLLKWVLSYPTKKRSTYL